MGLRSRCNKIKLAFYNFDNPNTSFFEYSENVICIWSGATLRGSQFSRYYHFDFSILVRFPGLYIWLYILGMVGGQDRKSTNHSPVPIPKYRSTFPHLPYTYLRVVLPS